MTLEKQQILLEKFEQLCIQEKTQAAACKKIGISTSIMTQLKSGKYQGDIEKQFKLLEDYFNLKEEAKSKSSYRTDKYVPTSISSEVYNYIRNVQLKGGLMTIAGDAGIGKTRAIMKYYEEYPNSSIWITANPCMNTVKPILKKICKTLGITNVRNNYEMFDSIVDKLRDGMVIIFDEAQHISLKAIETLRGFSDYFSDRGQTLGIAFVGNMTTMDKFGAKEEAVFAQIANRTIQKPTFFTTDITREDIHLLYPDIKENSKEEDLMLAIAQSKEGIRGANNLFTNATDNEDISYNGLLSMAKHMKMMI